MATGAASETAVPSFIATVLAEWESGRATESGTESVPRPWSAVT